MRTHQQRFLDMVQLPTLLNVWTAPHTHLVHQQLVQIHSSAFGKDTTSSLATASWGSISSSAPSPHTQSMGPPPAEPVGPWEGPDAWNPNYGWVRAAGAAAAAAAAGMHNRRTAHTAGGAGKAWPRVAPVCVFSAPPSSPRPSRPSLGASRPRYRPRAHPPCTPPLPPQPLAERSAIFMSFCLSAKRRVPFSSASWARWRDGESSTVARAC